MTTKTNGHQKGLSSFKPPENLSPPERSAAAVENIDAAPKKLLPSLLNILCCQIMFFLLLYIVFVHPSCDHILDTFFAHRHS
uniref:Uncharacterized protein n=1 Tax=Tanacetum cinerariifolium TaxID=118510 RepID=A0A6L2P5T8_TANCI|nr:hypothetical protein [Tanacetum cinerariifolium]